MMSWKMGTLGLALFAQGFGPCSERSAAPARVEAEPKAAAVADGEHVRPPKQQTPTPATYMKGHFAEAEVMRRALIGGRLSDFKAAAAEVAVDDWSPNLRPTWKAHLTDVRAAARAINAAASLRDGTEALSDLGSACASCHRSVGGPAGPGPLTAPVKDEERPMLEHAQAEEWLWRGLSFPSDSAWMSGARGLQHAPGLDSDVEEVSAAAHHLQSLAARAAAATESRPELYATILITCATCHERVGVKL
jgi:cytochrome c553